jgi:DNA-binding beta-propeller fold protein YncE
LDGTNAAVVLDNGSGGIHSLAIDPLLNKLYWAHTGAGPVSTIYRANLDGTTLETLIVGASPSSMRSIALDLENGQLYIDEGYSQEIQRANLDGTNLQTVLGDAQSPSVLPTGPAAVPEPATWLLVLLGLGFLSRCRRIGQRGR